MFARIARFEGCDPAAVDQQLAEMRSQLKSAKGGQLPADAP